MVPKEASRSPYEGPAALVHRSGAKQPAREARGDFGVVVSPQSVS